MRVRRIVLYIVLGTVTYAAALVATLPAAVAYRWFVPNVSNLDVYDISGTLWHGRAAIKLNSITFDTVEWQCHPLALFSAHLGYRVAAKSDTGDLHGSVTMAQGGQLAFDAMQGTLPVSSFEAWLPLPSHSLSGMLSVDIAHAALDDGHPVALDGTLDLNDTRLLWPTGLTLGDYRLKLTTGAHDIHGTATDESGPVHLQASGTFSPTGNYAISGTLAPGAESNAKIKRALQYLGEPDTRGRYHFSVNGQLN